MKQWVLLGCLMGNITLAYAGPSVQTDRFNHLNTSMYVEYADYTTDFKGNTEDIDFNGVALGVSSSPYTSGWYGRFEGLSNKDYDVDYYELVLGGQLKLLNYHGFYALATAGLGYGWMSSDQLYNTVNFMSLPIGLEVGIAIVPELALYGGVGYKWLWDVTSDARCNDGDLNQSMNGRPCKWQGGVDYYYDSLGDNAGMTYKAGLRYNF